MENIALKPSQAKLALKTAIDARQPIMFYGAPGVGKSAIVAETAAELGIGLKDVRVALLDPVDLRGVPSVKDGRTVWNVPEFLPGPKDPERGILFLDELNAAPQMVQAACYQLVRDRRLGEYELPEGWTIVAAGNRESDRAVVSRMPSALRNRFLNVDFQIDMEDWVQWGLSAGIETSVLAFIRFRPALLHAETAFSQTGGPKVDWRELREFPTPRAWEFVSKIVEQKPDAAIEYAMISGCVGSWVAGEFMGFIKIWRNLPDVDAIIRSPDKEPIPTDPATLYALMGALARRATRQNFDRIVRYITRDEFPKEFAVICVKDASARDKSLKQTRAMIEFGVKIQDVII